MKIYISVCAIGLCLCSTADVAAIIDVSTLRASRDSASETIVKMFHDENRKTNDIELDSNKNLLFEQISQDFFKDEEIKENPEWIEGVSWLNWKVVPWYDNEDFKMAFTPSALFIADKDINGNKLLLSMWQHRVVYYCSLYLIPGDYYEEFVRKVANLDNDQMENALLEDRRIKMVNLVSDGDDFLDNGEVVRVDTNYTHFRNVFQYDGRFFMFLGRGDGDNFLLAELTEDMKIVPRDLLRKYNSVKHKQRYVYLELYAKFLDGLSGCATASASCSGTTMSECTWHDGSGFISELLSKEQKVWLINTNTDYDYKKYLDGEFLTGRSLIDIWSQRYYAAFKETAKLAHADLVKMFTDSYGAIKKKAVLYADYYMEKSLRMSVDGHYGGGLSNIPHDSVYDNTESYDVIDDRQAADQWLKSLIKALQHGKLNPEAVYEFYYNRYTMDNADKQSLLTDHIEFVDQKDFNKLNTSVEDNYFGKNLLMYAAHMNNYASSARLAGTDQLNEVTRKPVEDDPCLLIQYFGRSALTYAVENSSKELIAMLVQSGANYRIKDSSGHDLTYYLGKNPYLNKDDIGKGLGFFEELKNVDFSHIAPSFDCSQATSKYEKAVCSSDTLSNYDKSMSIIYGKLKRTPEFVSLRQSQRDWIKGRKTTCDQFGAGSDYKACLARELRGRTYFLQQLYGLHAEDH